MSNEESPYVRPPSEPPDRELGARQLGFTILCCTAIGAVVGLGIGAIIGRFFPDFTVQLFGGKVAQADVMSLSMGMGLANGSGFGAVAGIAIIIAVALAKRKR